MTPSTERTWTIGELLNATAQFLARKGVESPRLDAEILLAKALDCKRIDLYGLLHEEPATDAVRQQYRDLIRRRVEGCPVAYLVGYKEFFSLRFDVSPAVLIPRPDTEVLVTACIDALQGVPSPRLLDVGTGSGCLAVTLAHQLPDAEVTATDISAAALDVARSNARKFGLDKRIRFFEGDLFAPLAEGDLFDAIVSNPPYIPHGDLPNLPVGVRDYEPAVALDGGPDGYVVFDRLVREAPRFLRPGGHLLLEIGSPQEGPARRRIESYPFYRLAPTIYDHSRHPRVLKARYEPAS